MSVTIPADFAFVRLAVAVVSIDPYEWNARTIVKLYPAFLRH
jgi:hypothetical protein